LLPHTGRAALTGLRWRGYAIERRGRAVGARAYAIAAGLQCGGSVMGRPAQFPQIAALPSKSTAAAASILKPLGVQAELTALERLDLARSGCNGAIAGAGAPRQAFQKHCCFA